MSLFNIRLLVYIITVSSKL